MRRSFRIFLLALWVVVATLALGRWWMLRPETFPSLPDALWQSVMARFDPGCCEDVADVEALVVLVTAFVVVLAVTVLGWLFWRRLRPA